MSTRRRTPNRANGLARQVAEKAGVSLMTVSRVFNDSPRVSPRTRERVLAMAQELGYEPNIAARALRKGRPMMVGFIAATPEALDGPYHSATLVALESVLGPAGYTIAMMVPRGDETIAAMIRRLVASRACAANILRLDHFEGLGLEELSDLDAPVLFAGGSSPDFLGKPPFSTARFDNRSGIIQAVRHLHALGHKKIAYLGGTPGWLDAEERLDGFLSAMNELGLQVQDRWVRACSFASSYQTGQDAANAVLASGKDLPTAFVCASDEIAAGVYASAERWGRKIPGDLSVIGFDANLWCDFLRPPLTTVLHSGLELGQKVGELALRLIERDEPASKDILLETRLVVRSSTAPPRK